MSKNVNGITCPKCGVGLTSSETRCWQCGTDLKAPKEPTGVIALKIGGGILDAKVTDGKVVLAVRVEPVPQVIVDAIHCHFDADLAEVAMKRLRELSFMQVLIGARVE